MPFPDLAALAVALAMDAFSVALATGITLKRVNRRQIFRLGWHFGLFQAVMPLFGWSAGLTIQELITAFDHWIAFGLLGVVGGNMIREALMGDDQTDIIKDPTRGWSLVMLSVATSIDALAVGLSLAMLKVPIIGPAAVIGLTTAAFTTAGLLLGQTISTARRVSRWAGLSGGIVLFLIGLRILYEHGVFT